MAEKISIGEDCEIIIGLSWEEKLNVKTKIKSFILKDIKKEAETNNYFTYTKLHNQSINYSFVKNSVGNTIVGAKCLSENLDNAIFVYEYQEKTRTGLKDKWWFCSIIDRHSIEEDLIFDDYNLLLEKVKESTAVISKKIVAFEKNLTITLSIDTYIDSSYFTHFDGNKDYELQPVRQPLAWGYLWGSLICICFLGLIYYWYSNYENSTHQDIKKGGVLAPLMKIEGELKGYKSEEKRTGKTKQDVVEQGKKEFLREYYSNLYSTKEIHDNLTALFDLPFFIYDWQLSKIIFKSKGNQPNETMFYFIFQRLPESTGTYQDVINSLEVIEEDIGVDIQPLGFGSDKGDFYIFQADFDIASKKDLFLKYSQYTDYVSLRDNEVAKQAEIVANYKNNIYSLIEDSNQLTKLELLGGKEQDKIKQLIDVEVMRLQLKYGDILRLAKTQAEPIEINSEFTDNSTSQYILLKQQDYLYNWSLPKLSRTYPDWKRFVKENTDKQGKKSVDKEIYAEFAREYDFEVMSVKDLSENFVSMLSVMRLMNDPSIQIKQVEYNIQEGTWAIKASFYERQN